MHHFLKISWEEHFPQPPQKWMCNQNFMTKKYAPPPTLKSCV